MVGTCAASAKVGHGLVKCLDDEQCLFVQQRMDVLIRAGMLIIMVLNYCNTFGRSCPGHVVSFLCSC